jgi:nucleoside recognition membrane protein YjiH
MISSTKKTLGFITLTSLAVAPVASQAAVDPAVTTALTSAGTDAATVGVAVLVVIVSIFAFKLLRKTL